jgi:hypothetical protein
MVFSRFRDQAIGQGPTFQYKITSGEVAQFAMLASASS